MHQCLKRTLFNETRQDKTRHTFLINRSFSSIGQDNIFTCSSLEVRYNSVEERSVVVVWVVRSIIHGGQLDGLLFPISSSGSFICTIPRTEQHIPQPLLYPFLGVCFRNKMLTNCGHVPCLAYTEHNILHNSVLTNSY